VLEKPKKEVKQNGVSVDGKNLSDGETVDYSITVKNPSSMPADIRISDKLPEYLEIKSIKDGGRSENGTLRWDLRDVRAKETVTVKFTAVVKGGEEARDIVNSATVSMGDRDLMTNDTILHVPAVIKLRLLGEKKSPETISTNNNTGVLGERKIGTGDGSCVLVFILLAMCAFACLEIIKVRKTYED
jgi:fimbrial isopeptide formation D2 family protein